MQTMARLLQRGRPPSDVMALTAAEDAQRGRYQPCPCGSGRKFRSCHGNSAPHTPFSGLDPATHPPQTMCSGHAHMSQRIFAPSSATEAENPS